jgi:hypothetical protein
MKKIICLIACMFACSASATVIDLTTLAHGNSGTPSLTLPEATITNISGGNLFIGKIGLTQSVCAVDPQGLTCEQDLKIDFNYLVNDLSFHVGGRGPRDFVTAYIYDISNTLISSLDILSDGIFDFAGASNISTVIFDDQSTGSNGVSYSSISFNAASVPEPSSIALLGLGIAGLGLSRKRKAS